MVVSSFRIPLLRPSIPTAVNLLPYLMRIDQNKVYSNGGPLVRELEARFSEYFDVPVEQIVLLSNATLAIQGIATILPVTKFVVPDFTFAATGQAIVASGKQLILADIEPTNWQLNLPKHFLGDQVGFVPVMPFGAEVPVESWKNQPNVIYDAAASIGSRRVKLNGLNKMSAVVYSLHATKVAGSGEGAVVVCGSTELAADLKAWSNFGFDENRIALSLGTNAKMSEYTAAVVSSVLDNLDVEFNEWEFSLTLANESSMRLGFDSIVSHYIGVRPYWIAQFENKKIRDQVSEHLKVKSIQSRSWWSKPLSQMPPFSKYGEGRAFIHSCLVNDTTLGLPMFRGLTEVQIEEIAKIVSGVIN